MPNQQRRRGEGNVRLRIDGRWEARIQMHGLRRTAIRATEAAAWQALRKIERAAEDDEPVVDSRITVARYLDEWLAAVSRSLKPNTVHAYRHYVRAYLIPGLGRYRLAALTPEHVDRFLDRLADPKREPRPLAPKTIHHIRSTLRRALNIAIRRGRLLHNAAALSIAPRVPKPKPDTLSIEAARSLAELCKDDPMGAFYMLVLETGLREGEALGACWADLDLKKRRLAVRRAVSRVDRQSYIDDPKSEDSARTVEFSAYTAQLIHAHRSLQLAARLAAGNEWNALDLVFADAYGRPLVPTTVYGRWRRFRAKHKLGNVTIHGLRHTMASLLLSDGASLKDVSERLGHSSIAITADIYGHLSIDSQRRTSKRMNDILGGAETG